MANTPYETKAEAEAKRQETYREIKQVAEAISAGEGGVSFSTLNEAKNINPKPIDGTVFQVDGDSDNNGIYKFLSSEPEGVKFLRKNIFPSTIINCIEKGDMQDLSYWSGSNYTISQASDGIKITAPQSTSTKIFATATTLSNSVDGTEDFLILLDVTNNSGEVRNHNIILANGANTAFRTNDVSFPVGRNVVAARIDRDSYTHTGTVKLYINSGENKAIDETIHSVIMINGNESQLSSLIKLKSIYSAEGYFNELVAVVWSFNSAGGVDAQRFENFESSVEGDLTNLKKVGNKTFENVLPYGAMNDVSKWSSGTQETDGISISGSGTILSTVNTISIDSGDELTLVFDVSNNESVSKSVKLSLYNGQYSHNSGDIELKPGKNTVSVLMNHVNLISGNMKLYINTVSGASVDLLIHSILLMSSTTKLQAKNLYLNSGFFYPEITISSGSVFALNGVDPDEFNELNSAVESLQTEKEVIVLKAYATGTQTQADEDAGIFRGVVSDKNAIQRAVESVPNDTKENYEIRCYGNFSATSFAEMSAPDLYGRQYKGFISLTGKRNIKLVGTGSKKTIISCVLPSSGAPVAYDYYQNITMDCVNCELENLQIIGQNLRYPVHTDTTGATNYNKNSTLKFTNVHFWHKGNEGDALLDWSSLSSFGIGISQGMTMIFKGCRFTSKNDAGLSGHDGYQEENSVLIIHNSHFDASEGEGGKSMQWNLFGNNFSKWNIELIGNNFGCKKLVFNKGANNSEFYANIKGHGNSKFLFETAHDDNPFPELSDVLHHNTNQNGSSISKGDCITEKGLLATGEIFAIAIDDAVSGDNFRAIRNTLVKISDISTDTDTNLVEGDYAEANNGLLIKSTEKTSAKVVSIDGGTLCLEIN
jgi:hypothetical protein